MGFQKGELLQRPFSFGLRAWQAVARPHFFFSPERKGKLEREIAYRQRPSRTTAYGPDPSAPILIKSAHRQLGNLHTISTSLFTRKEIMPQSLSIYQKPPPAAACGTRLELVARYDLGLTLPHNLVTHRFYFLSASMVSTLVEPCDDGQTPRRPGTRHSMRRHAARKRAREAPR